jgi:putative membrane protein
MRHSICLALIGALALTPACKKKSDTTATPTTGSGSGSSMAGGSGSAMPTAMGSGSGSATAPAPGGLTDPQIAAIVVAANQVDIDAGNLALKKTKNEEVKKFAQQMVTDHTAVNKAAGDLVAKLKVTPEETDASKGLVSGGADNRAKLEKLDGAAFDKAYVDNEVAYHKAVIDVVDTKLIPSASNAELKNTLVSVRPTLEEHLKHAEMVQSQLGSGSGAAGGSAAGSGSAAHHHKK